MRITVLGSTGPTGKSIVRQALLAEYEVTAVTRTAYLFDHPGLEVKQGDVASPAFLQDALNGSDAVLSALGSHDMKSSTTLYSSSASAAIAAMRASAVRRFICISASPVMPETLKPALNRYVLDPVLHQFFGGGYDDMRRMETILAKSDLDWTVFRPPYLRNARARGHYRVAIDSGLPFAFSITREDLAAAMLAAITDSKTFHHAVMIAN